MKRLAFLLILPLFVLGFAGCASNYDANTGGDVPGTGKTDAGSVAPTAAPGGAGANVKF